jgi:hypothetical protein
MKLIKTFLCAAMTGTIVFAAGKASAFPLILKSIGGKVVTTVCYGTTAETTTNEYAVERFNLKEMMCLITNTVKSIEPDIALPEDVALAVEPYNTNIIGYGRSDVYLTNSQGFYFNLSASNLASFYISNIATKFKTRANGSGSENDVVSARLNIGNVFDQNGVFYQIDLFGSGTINLSLKKNGEATMIISVKGAGPSLERSQGVQTNTVGVCTGSFAFKGSGIPTADGFPFSVYWWNNLRSPVQVVRTNLPPVEPPAVIESLANDDPALNPPE